MHSVGYRNSSNVIAPHVIPIAKKDCYLAEEATPSNCKSTSIACHQRRSYCTKRVSGKGLALTWLKRWWLPLAFNASHQTSWLHLCGEDPWTVLPWLPRLTRGLGLLQCYQMIWKRKKREKRKKKTKI